MSYQAYLDAVERKTGKTPGELLAEAAQRGITPTTKAAEVVAWLKDEYDVGRGHAMALYGVLKNGATISDKHVSFRGPRGIASAASDSVGWVESGGTHSDPSTELRLDGLAKR
jgi:hypothetical protein